MKLDGYTNSEDMDGNTEEGKEAYAWLPLTCLYLSHIEGPLLTAQAAILIHWHINNSFI
jgi:hypothetical protein